MQSGLPLQVSTFVHWPQALESSKLRPVSRPRFFEASLPEIKRLGPVMFKKETVTSLLLLILKAPAPSNRISAG
jgi:hypothetical protein